MKIFCIGRNYVDHAKELNNPVPKKPLVFMKPMSALLIKNKPLYYPEFTKDLHFEAEIVLKICKNGKHVEQKFAHKYYNEIAFGIDFTARDVQAKCKEKGHPWEIAKGFDGSGGLSKFMPKEQFNTDAIEFHLTKNGETVQKGNTKDLIFSFDYLITYLSTIFKIQTGDIIYTGTPAGVGPLQIGDKLEGYIETNLPEKSTVKLIECTIK